jgi:hypothetical protein
MKEETKRTFDADKYQVIYEIKKGSKEFPATIQELAIILTQAERRTKLKKLTGKFPDDKWYLDQKFEELEQKLKNNPTNNEPN